MKLLTKEILKALPNLYENENKSPENIRVPLKLFDPCGRGTWYITELDPNPDNGLLAFGFCVSPLGPDCDELGYVSIQELSEVEGLVKIERDIYWNPRTTLADVISGKTR